MCSHECEHCTQECVRYRPQIETEVIKCEVLDTRRVPIMAKSKKTSVDRRGFLKGAAAGAAALVAKPELATAQQAVAQGGQTGPNRGANGSAAEPTQVALARENGARPGEASRVIEHPGSDYMVDVIKSLNI